MTCIPVASNSLSWIVWQGCELPLVHDSFMEMMPVQIWLVFSLDLAFFWRSLLHWYHAISITFDKEDFNVEDYKTATQYYQDGNAVSWLSMGCLKQLFDSYLIYVNQISAFLEILEFKVVPSELWWECSVPQASVIVLYQWSFQLSVRWRLFGPNCCIVWGRQVASGSYQIKDKGSSSRLWPQAQQILDSAAAGWGLRPDSTAGSCRNKIRPVANTVHPWMCMTGMLQKLCLAAQFQVIHTVCHLWLAS